MNFRYLDNDPVEVLRAVPSRPASPVGRRKHDRMGVMEWIIVFIVLVGMMLTVLVVLFMLRAYYRARLMQMPAMQLLAQHSSIFRRVKASAPPQLRAIPAPVEWPFLDFGYGDGRWMARGEDRVYRGTPGPRAEVPARWETSAGDDVTDDLKASLDAGCRQAIVEWNSRQASVDGKEPSDATHA